MNKRPYKSKDFTQIINAIKERSKQTELVLDESEGSVVNLLQSVFCRELAIAYQQLNCIYENAYVSTARQSSLENVVKLIGLERKQAGHLEAQVSFSAKGKAEKDIVIPPSFRITSKDLPAFETIEECTIFQGKTSATVKARSLTPSPLADQSSLTDHWSIPRPLAGVESVKLIGELKTTQQAESDEELRHRAFNNHLHYKSSTVQGLEYAVKEELSLEKVAIQSKSPGNLTVLIADEDFEEKYASIKNDVRLLCPAGIWVEVDKPKEVEIRLNAIVELDDDYGDMVHNHLKAELESQVRAYVASLEIGSTLHWTCLQKILYHDPRVTAIHCIDSPENKAYHFTVVKQNQQPEYTNGDIIINSNEIAVLDRDRMKILVEPLNLPIDVDVEIEYLKAPDEEELRRAVIACLEAFNRKTSSQLSFLDITTNVVLDSENESILSISINHQRRSQVIILTSDQGNHIEDLGQRAYLRLRNLRLLKKISR